MDEIVIHEMGRQAFIFGYADFDLTNRHPGEIQISTHKSQYLWVSVSSTVKLGKELPSLPHRAVILQRRGKWARARKCTCKHFITSNMSWMWKASFHPFNFIHSTNIFLEWAVCQTQGQMLGLWLWIKQRASYPHRTYILGVRVMVQQAN